LSGLSRKVCLEMAERARALGKPEATVDVARICMGVAV
jgi:UDP-N-acetylglucosamine--N-acetylmuramyl-(pentapeptide) pyrophosphoryl-undecaprenol N-acetylglucosamine transferase